MSTLTLGTSIMNPPPRSKEITFAANSKSTAAKITGPVAVAFSKKDVTENETLCIEPVELISSELSAKIKTLEPNMISMSDEVQHNMTAFDAFANTQIDNFKRLEKRSCPELKEYFSATNEKFKSVRMDIDNISQLQECVINNVEVLGKRIDLLKCNINASKGDKIQDEKVDWHYMNYMADEMESRLEEYKQFIPKMEESISNISVDILPSVSNLNNAINVKDKILINLAGRVAKIRDHVHTLCSRRTPPL